MAAIPAESIGDLRATLRGFIGAPDRANEWYEAAFRVHIERNRLFAPWPVPSTEWVEIDNADDLHAAKALFT
jgi:hypothetical protein